MDFTTLFTQTLNETIARIVAEAVAKVTEQYDVQLVAMQTRIEELEENAATGPDIDGDIEKFIEQYDFSDAVAEHVNVAALFEGDDFDDAVKAVISGALDGRSRSGRY